jgi:hypothetical protein
VLYQLSYQLLTLFPSLILSHNVLTLALVSKINTEYSPKEFITSPYRLLRTGANITTFKTSSIFNIIYLGSIKIEIVKASH